MLARTIYKSTQTRSNQKPNNQVIIHTQINNYKPLKEYIINLNGIGNNNNKYNRHISPENFLISQQKSYKNKYTRNQNEFMNNSFTQFNAVIIKI